MMVAPSSIEAWVQQHTIGVLLALLRHPSKLVQVKDDGAICSIPTCSAFTTMHSVVDSSCQLQSDSKWCTWLQVKALMI